jgi:hypothetical protein
MKKFNQLKQRLAESEYSDGGSFNAAYDGTTSRSAASDYGIHRIENDTQKNRLHAFLQTFAQKDYLDPRSAFALLRAKVNLAGLDFQFNPNVPLLTNTEMRFPMTRFGGVFGTTPTHDLSKGFIESDGITDANDGKGLELVVMITRNGASGLFKFNIRMEETGGEINTD